MRLGRVVVRLALVATLASLLQAMLPTSAYAAWTIDNMVGNPRYDDPCLDATQAKPHFVCRTDNASVSYFFENEVDSPSRTRVAAVLSASFSPTRLSIHHVTTIVDHGSGETDIVYRHKAADFGKTKYIGYTWCDDAVNGGWYECDQQYVNFKNTNIPTALACHESGHAVGLLHGNNASPYTDPEASANGCMTNPLNETRTTLSSNSKDSINNYY